MQYFKIVITILVLSREFICERLHKQIYSSIEGSAACFRLLNGTHQVGCSSSESGAVGAIHMIRLLSDADWLVHNGTAGPYIAVVNTALFRDVIIKLIDQPDNVAGVLLYHNASMRPDFFSQESRCPNEYSASDGSQCSSSEAGGLVWNEQGTGLLRQDIPFPIFYLPQSQKEEIVKIEQCYERYNVDKNNQKGQPLCSIQLNSFMFAVLNSQVCLRRSAASALFTTTKVCDPLGDYNVYYSLFPRGKENSTADDPETKPKPIILVTARIDTTSLFDGVAPGAASSVVGMVTLIMAAAALARMIPESDAHLYTENVVWTLLNGESFDYIGSQRAAYDLAQGAWPPPAPLARGALPLHVELGQLGGALRTSRLAAAWPLRAHAPYTPDAAPEQVKEFIDELSRIYGSNITMNGPNVPPSSIHSFRRILGNGSAGAELPKAVLLADHEHTFTNTYYESVLDDADNIGFVYHNISIGTNGTFLSTEWLLSNGSMSAGEPQVRAARLATALAGALHRRLTGAPYAGNVTASAHLADELLYCFLQSQQCRALAAAEHGRGADGAGADGAGTGAAGAGAAPLYVGVVTWPSAPAACAAHLLALLTGRALPADRARCDELQTLPDESGYLYYYLKGWNGTGVCMRTTANLTQAVSPAFIIPDYDMTSGVYSTWTESVWAGMWARVFVSAGGGGARAAGAAGALATLLAAALAFTLRRRASSVFAATAPPAAPDAAAGILRSVNC